MKKIQCIFCPRKFNKLDTFHEHEAMHLGEKPVRCRSCDRSFASRKRLDAHITRMHSAAKDRMRKARLDGRTCSYCNRVFPARRERISHERIHTGAIVAVGVRRY